MKIIKRYFINKIVVYTLCLFLIILFYFVPTKEEVKYNVVEQKDLKESVVYLLDNDEYLSRVILYYDNKTIESEINNIINILINGSDEYSFFHPLIPKNTKVNSIKIDKDSVYIDFNNKILDVNKYYEEQMIEAIVYSLTEINGINNIYISVNGKRLDKLPNSKISLPYPLTRKYGINKEYDLNSLFGVNKTTIYFSKNVDDYSYYVPVTKINNDKSDKIQIIISELKSSVNSVNNLNSYLDDKTKLIDYNISDKSIELVFNDYLFSDKKVLESVEYIISSSIFENYEVDKLIINNSDKSINIEINNT